MVVTALSLLAAYLIGSIPFGVILARRRGVDLRTYGSGNIGATNAARVLGLASGLAVLVLDAAKGAIAVWIAMRLTWNPRAIEVAAFAAIVGHCFSPFLGFAGGKGVATTLGAIAMLSLPLALIGIAVFLAIAGRTKVVALGSLAGVAAACVASFVAYPEHRLLCVAVLVLLVYTHRSNLERLMHPPTPM